MGSKGDQRIGRMYDPIVTDAPVTHTGKVRWLLGFLGLFSGTALVAYLVLSVDLRIGMIALASSVIVVLATIFRRSDAMTRRWIARTIGYGAVAGLVATVAYDATRSVLTALDPSPYRPFEVISRFGELLVGTAASPTARLVAGAGFHALNGSSFGIAYAFLFAADGRVTMRKGLLLGLGWGLFLEAFQIALYPGWLSIRYMNEFLTISALGHLAYGGTLAGVSIGLLRRASREPRVASPPRDELRGRRES
jgi:hypothetical protein